MSNETEVAVLFADVVGSTRLYELLGDLKARDMVVTCVDLMRAATERNRGSVIKTIGDEILAIFPTANDAVNAAGEMQQDIGAHPGLSVQGQHVAIRIGCHFGPVVLENRDIFGASVHTANRMTSQAKAGQIILTSEMVGRLSPEWRAVTRQIDVTPLRGRTEEVELFEVMWQQEDATSMLPSIEVEARTGHRPKRVRLRFKGRDLVLGDGKDSLTMGRAEENDIVVQGSPISRIHAKIEIARNRVMLVDQSTNGTFVVAQDGKESFVRRDSLHLVGQGMIGLGKLPDSSAPDAIRYQVED
ncbi:MAG TPA: adenylate/guanylate cyclase domain-containing protein [Steroidobacteraceae bacterium]|nr:adenylate/guanylate cyclase domain-containing protein [Steroidobacteraceae bacterium]